MSKRILWACMLMPMAMMANGLQGQVLVPETVVTGTPALWRQLEIRVDGIPPVDNPFDPDQIRVDATFALPSGRSITVPGFWFQDFVRELVDGSERLTAAGSGGWRVRFTPTESGEHRVSIAVAVGGESESVGRLTQFVVPDGRVDPDAGWVQVGADGRHLATSLGRPLRLIGANVCWAGQRGTHDFDAWFAAMAKAGENFARLWFSPWSFGIEHRPGTLNRYQMEGAWQLDHIMALAGKHGIYVLIAMDHHGMYMVDDPAWRGSNNFWTSNNPYSRELGGPCADPDEFFTSPAAREIYRKRLRYLIGRYGANPRLISWQFFNEIDNAYIPRSTLVGDHVVAWHRDMGAWLRANDPWGHLISTSLTGGVDRPEFWTLPEMDFSVYHSYGEANPSACVAALAADFVTRYGKPVMVGEFGTNAGSWRIADDPYLRGFRQGIWGGVLGGSMGTSMSWWWEDLHDDHVYPIFATLKGIMNQAGWEEGAWVPAALDGPGEPPLELVAPIEGGEPFSADLALNALRRNRVAGEAAIADPLAAARSAERLSTYLHGPANPHLQQHLRVVAHFAGNGRMLLRVNAVASDDELVVRIDGDEVLREAMPNLDGMAVANGEIGREFTVPVGEGRRVIEIAHIGHDWINLDRVRLEQVRPCAFAGGWRFDLQPVGLRQGEKAIVYVSSPYVAWPAGARRFNPPAMTGGAVVLREWPAGVFHVSWHDPRDGGTRGAGKATTRNGRLVLEVPDLSEDLVGLIRPDAGSSRPPSGG